MKYRPLTIAGAIAVALCAIAFTLTAAPRAGQAQEPLPPGIDVAAAAAAASSQNGSAFTYQGQLRKNGAPVNATCAAVFALFDADIGGTQIGGPIVSATLQVANGLFTIPLDFGWGPFTGEARWLSASIGCGEPVTVMTPRTALRPAPYALALPGLRTVPGDPDAFGSPSMNVIGGVFSGTISNTISADSANSVIGGGLSNRIDGASYQSAIGGGDLNLVTGDSYQSFIGSGHANRIDNESYRSIIVGGSSNDVDRQSLYSAIGGGIGNSIERQSSFSAIGGGSSNHITTAQYAVIPGGLSNYVVGDYAFAAGRKAQALHDGVFVWGDSTDDYVASSGPNQFVVRASGGVTMFTNAGATTGARLFAGSGSWTSMSDRAVKSNVAAVDPRAVLEAVAALPVSTWNYNAQDPGIRHIGPMAQDFYAAFGVGETDTGISAVDAQGVALAAIQGLKAENAELKARLDRLERNQAGTQMPPWTVALGTVALGTLALSVVGVCVARRRKAPAGMPIPRGESS